MTAVYLAGLAAAWFLGRLCARWNEAERLDVAVRAALMERDRMHARRVHPARPAYAKRLEDLMTDAHPETVTN